MDFLSTKGKLLSLAIAVFLVSLVALFYFLTNYSQSILNQPSGIQISFISKIPNQKIIYTPSSKFSKALNTIVAPQLHIITVSVQLYPPTGMPNPKYLLTYHTASGVYNYNFRTTQSSIMLDMNIQGFAPDSAYFSEVVEKLILSIAQQQKDTGQSVIVLNTQSLPTHQKYVDKYGLERENYLSPIVQVQRE